MRECESINGDHGLWHRTAKGNTKITLRHIVDPVCGYAFDVCHVPSEISPRSKTCREAGGYAGPEFVAAADRVEAVME